MKKTYLILISLLAYCAISNAQTSLVTSLPIGSLGFFAPFSGYNTTDTNLQKINNSATTAGGNFVYSIVGTNPFSFVADRKNTPIHALSFNGTGYLVGDINFSGTGFSFGCWLHTGDIANNGLSVPFIIGNDYDNRWFEVSFTKNNLGRSTVSLIVRANSTDGLSAALSSYNFNSAGQKVVLYDDNEWVYFAFTFARAGANNEQMAYKAYVNGSQQLSAQYNFASVPTSTTKLYIGGASKLNAAYQFNGRIDDLIFYNRTLSNQEIIETYNYVAPIGNTVSGVATSLHTSNAALGIKVYPVPAQANELTIDVTVPETAIDIVNSMGEVIYSSHLYTGTHRLPIQLVPGVYMLSTTHGYKKIIIE